MSSRNVDGPNAGYASLLLDEYLENPEAVPAEWRAPFETGGRREPLASPPGLRRLLDTAGDRAPVAVIPTPTNGDGAAALAEPPPSPAAPVTDEALLGSVAAAMALVKAHRTHGHLAARLDPLGSEPPGERALDETMLIPPLTPELQARIPASLLRLHVPGETLLDALPALREVYCGTIAYEL